MAVWDDESWHILASRHVKLARDAGALSELPPRDPVAHPPAHPRAASWSRARRSSRRRRRSPTRPGASSGPNGALGVAAWRGREAEATELIQATMDGVTSRGEGRGVTSQYARCPCCTTASATTTRPSPPPSWRASTTTSASSAGRSPSWSRRPSAAASPRAASDALQRLTETTRASGTDWALGTEAPLACPAESGPGRRELLPRGDRAARPYPHAAGRGPRPPAVRRMAAPLRTGAGTPRAELRTAHDLFTRDGHRGVRRAGPA